MSGDKVGMETGAVGAAAADVADAAWSRGGAAAAACNLAMLARRRVISSSGPIAVAAVAATTVGAVGAVGAVRAVGAVDVDGANALLLPGAGLLTGTVTSCVLAVAAATDGALRAAVVVTTVDATFDGATACEAMGEACKAAMLARNRAISSSGPEGPTGAATAVVPEATGADCTAVVA